MNKFKFWLIVLGVLPGILAFDILLSYVLILLIDGAPPIIAFITIILMIAQAFVVGPVLEKEIRNVKS